MNYMLDKNTCIYLIKNRPPQVRTRFQDIQPQSIGISSIVYLELEYGMLNRNSEKAQIALQTFLKPLRILSFSKGAAALGAKIDMI